jgi:hypothetical protein
MAPHQTLLHPDSTAPYYSSLNITLPKPPQNKTKPHRTLLYHTDTNHDGTILYLTIPLLTFTALYDTITKQYGLYAAIPSQDNKARHVTVQNRSPRDRYCSIQANNLRHLTETFTKRYLIRHNLHDSKTKPRPYNTSHNIFLYHRNTEQRRDYTITILIGMTIRYLLCHTSPWLDDTVPCTTSTSHHLTKRNQTITRLSLTRPPLQLTCLN